MLSVSPVGFAFDDDDWIPSPHAPRLYRTASVGSWGVTSIGRGFDWENESNIDTVDEAQEPVAEKAQDAIVEPTPNHGHAANGRKHHHSFPEKTPTLKPTPFSMTSSPRSISQPLHIPTMTPVISPLTKSPSSPRPRRRSSQQRVSLIAGRVSIAPIDPPPSPPPMLSENLKRTPSSGSLLSNHSALPPSPDEQGFLGGRNISEFVIEGEIGRGAYGLVKRAREIQGDGSLGVSIPLSVPGLNIVYTPPRVAPSGYQTGYQAEDPRRLLEKTSTIWHHPH